MILSNRAISCALKKKKIKLSPLPEPHQFAPSALDLRVGDQFFCWKKARGGSEISFNLSSFDIQECADFIETVRPESDGRIKLNTGDFMLAKTLEYISLEYACQIAARVEGRSSFARLGLQVHMTAPTIHCGFSGTITLELKNCGRHALMITPNDTCICQLIFEKVSGKPVGPFNSKFFGQTDPIGRQ